MSSNRPSTCGRMTSRSYDARERRDEDFRARRHAQVIRPERHEPLDEGAIAGDARFKCRSRFACRELYQVATSFAAFLFVSLTRQAKAANGVADCARWRDVAGVQRRRAAIELCFQPASGIRDSLSLASAGAQSESIECAKCDVHTAAASRSGNANPGAHGNAGIWTLRRAWPPRPLPAAQFR